MLHEVKTYCVANKEKGRTHQMSRSSTKPCYLVLINTPVLAYQEQGNQ
jgi:hypothetical protein